MCWLYTFLHIFMWQKQHIYWVILVIGTYNTFYILFSILINNLIYPNTVYSIIVNYNCLYKFIRYSSLFYFWFFNDRYIRTGKPMNCVINTNYSIHVLSYNYIKKKIINLHWVGYIISIHKCWIVGIITMVLRYFGYNICVQF